MNMTFAFTPWEQGFVFESHDNVILVWPLTREAANWLHLIVEALWPDRVVFNGTAAIRLPNGRFFTAATHSEAIQKAIRAGKLPDEFRHDDFERGFVIGGKDFMEADEAKRVYGLSSSDDLIWFNGALAVELGHWPKVFMEIYMAGWRWSGCFLPYKGGRGFNGGRDGPPLQL